MKCTHLFLAVFLSFSPLLAYARPLAESTDINVDAQDHILASHLKDLEEQGYCVIPHVLSTSEAELLYQRVWHEFIEKAWPKCRMDDRSN